MKSLDPLRAKKTFIRKKLGHTAVSAISESITWQKEPVENTENLQFLTWQSLYICPCPYIVKTVIELYVF